MLSPKTNATAGMAGVDLRDALLREGDMAGVDLRNAAWPFDEPLPMESDPWSANATAGTVTEGPVCENPGLDKEIATHVMDNTVTINVEFKVGGKTYGVTGSGFFVAGTDGSIVVTADHVVNIRTIAEEKFHPEIRNELDAKKLDPESREGQELINDKMAEMEAWIAEATPTLKFRVTPCGGTKKGESFDVEIGASDATNDVAALRLEQPQTDYSGLKFAEEGSVEVLDEVWMTGLTGGIPCGFTPGTISNVSPDTSHLVGVNEELDVYQVNADLNPGNSGGVAANSEGEVVGLVSWKPLGTDGVGMITKAKHAEAVVKAAVEPSQIRENSMANEPVEDGFSALFMDVDEFLELDGEELQADVDSPLEQWLEANQVIRGNQPDSLLLPDSGHDLAVGKAFAAEVAADPSELGLSGITGGGIDPEPELDFELPFL